jgi:hypothetical protein
MKNFHHSIIPLLFLLALPFIGFCQKYNFNCQNPVFFRGTPVPDCNQVILPPNSCTTSLGGLIHHSSQLPSNVLSGNICVQGGNFFISANSSFTFQNANIIIAPNAEIVVEDGAELILDNATLKGCEGLWKGIRLSNYSSILTKNNTYIEGAQKAINASYVNATLDIENTTFNRNLTGIWLEDGPYAANPSNISYITNTVFMCDGQIPGTINQLSDNGIYSFNCPVSFKKGNEPDDYNLTFSNLKYGIKIEGIFSNKIKGHNFNFREIYYSAIYMERGVVELNQSNFVNYGQSGIFITLLRGITLNGCNFQISEADPKYFPNPTSSPRIGIYLGWDYYFPQIIPDIYIHNDNLFGFYCPTSDEIYNGIFMGGMGAKFKAYISNNKFIEYGKNCQSIHLQGDYSNSSVVEIFQNEFSTSSPANENNSNYSATGIYAVSNVNNLHIVANQFNTGVNDMNAGVSISQSMGFNNIISSNYFNTLSTYNNSAEFANAGVVLQSSANFKICSNYSAFGGRTFYFIGDNLGLDFSSNIFVGASGFDIQGRIGAQKQKDNIFYNFIYATYARCLNSNCDVDSYFEERYPINSEYYPYEQVCGSIDPCINDFFINTNGTPNSECLTEIVAPGEESLLLTIAKDEYSKDYPSNEWFFKSFLYSKLKNDTSGLLQNIDFYNFLQGNLTSEIGLLYVVDSLIKRGLDGGIGIIDTNLLKAALNINTNIISANPFAIKQKTVNEITILIFLRQEGVVSSQQIQILKNLSNECYLDGGASVSQSTGLLVGCDMNTKNPLDVCGNIYKSPYQFVSESQDREMQKTKIPDFPFQVLNGPDDITLLSSKIINGEILLTNINGQILYLKQIKNSNEDIRIDTNGLPNGLYFLTLKNEKVFSLKISIQH